MGNGNELERNIAQKKNFTSNGDFLEGSSHANPRFKDRRSIAAAERDTSQIANRPAAQPVAQSQESDGVSESITAEVGEHLAVREGFGSVVYLDTLGKPTVGTGHLLSSSEVQMYPVGTTVPASVLEAWRLEDSADAYAAAYMQGNEIGFESQALVNALSAVNFQLGTAWNEEHGKTWDFLIAQDWVGAAKEAADSTWFQQTPVRVVDFQRALLTIAGQATDYQAMVAFNADNVTKWGAVMPTEGSMNEFVPSAETDVENSTPTAAPKEDQETESSNSSEIKSVPEVKSLEITGPVGLDDDGTSYVGSNADVRIIQQQLVYAGFLPEEVMSRNGTMVTTVDGLLGGQTIAAINTFQSTVMGFRTTDGRVDVGGKTWNKLMSYSATAEVEENVAESGEVVSGGADVETPKENETEEHQTSPDTQHSDENESVDGGTLINDQVATTFENIPTAYSDKYKISRSVGYGTNTANDMERIKSLLQMLGYRTTTLVDYGKGKNAQAKALIQLKNSIFHFQQRHDDLSKDGRVDPNGGTWKKMVEVAYMTSGGQEMSPEQIAAEHDKRKGSRSDVPADLTANISGGHLLGIDKSGYLLPTEFHARARNLKTALETIKGEVGNYSISNGYRSPEHNVKIGSTAGKSQHVQGIAADIQTPSGYSASSLRTAINELIESGAIPAGGVGLYGWGVHYDTRGSHVQWSS